MRANGVKEKPRPKPGLRVGSIGFSRPHQGVDGWGVIHPKSEREEGDQDVGAVVAPEKGRVD